MRVAALILTLSLAFAACSISAESAGAAAKRQHTAHAKAHAKRYRTSIGEIHFRRTKGHLTRTARRGYHGKMTLNEILYGPAGMPPAPHDFGPHFDYPAAPLNGGITGSPYLH